MNEAGLPDFEVSVWHALYAPKGTPKPIIDNLLKALQDALDRIPRSSSASPNWAPNRYPRKACYPRGLARHLKAEIDKWAPIIKKSRRLRRLKEWQCRWPQPIRSSKDFLTGMII